MWGRILIFNETSLAGAFVIEPERLVDDRGFFGRSWCAREFAARGLDARLAQCNISFNSRRGTLRGMHFQVEPYGEGKLVRCTAGAIYDVIVDLRPDSATRHQWFGVDLTAANRTMLYIPPGFAHGFQTLADETEVFYQMTEFFVAGSAAGLRYDDPKLGISWPLEVTCIADKDLGYPLLT